jgi:hypothetical protein
MGCGAGSIAVGHGFEDGAEACAGAEGADFDIGFGPTGEGGDFFDGAVVEFDEGDNELVFGVESGECGADAEEGGVVGGCGWAGRCFWWEGTVEEEGVAGDLALAAEAVAAEEVEAGADGDFGEPVGEGGGGLVGGETAPCAEEDVLGEVFEFVVVAGVAGGHGEDAALVSGDEVSEGWVIACGSGAGEGGVVIGRAGGLHGAWWRGGKARERDWIRGHSEGESHMMSGRELGRERYIFGREEGRDNFHCKGSGRLLGWGLCLVAG